MNKSFKTLFTLFLGILFFIPTFTANSAVKKRVDVLFCKQEGYTFSNFKIFTDQHPNKTCPYSSRKESNYKKSSYEAYKYFLKIKKKENRPICIDKTFPSRVRWRDDSCRNKGPNWVELKHDGSNFYFVLDKTQIAKKEKKDKKQSLKCKLLNICEPTQTQQVAKKEKKKTKTKKVVKDRTYHCVAQDKSFPEQYLIIQVPCPSGYKSVSADEYANINKQKGKKVAKKKEEIKKQSQTTKVASKKIFKIGNKKSATESEEKCIKEEKTGFKIIDGKIKWFRKKYCISIQDIAELGIYQEFNAYPEGMLKEFKNCKKFFCQSKIASKKMYDIFVRRGEQYHARHPEKMIHGMAWFEIVFLAKHKKTMPAIERYIQYKQGNYNYKTEIKKSKDESEINSLIGMNKGRKNMRVAMGLSLEDDLAKVIRRHWLLGDLLGNDQVKVKKVKMNSDMKKRKELLTKYQAAMRKYKTKLEEEKNKKDL